MLIIVSSYFNKASAITFFTFKTGSCSEQRNISFAYWFYVVYICFLLCRTRWSASSSLSFSLIAMDPTQFQSSWKLSASRPLAWVSVTARLRRLSRGREPFSLGRLMLAGCLSGPPVRKISVWKTELKERRAPNLTWPKTPTDIRRVIRCAGVGP